ncbi:putative P-loop containing nucleoside triphosphate hydrolase protein [Seiridium cardinale]
MVLTTFQSEALNGLCSKERLDLMDSIDSLRSQGISHLISLPQIIVCGDQSSGKSSVLEAISGVSFPVKSNLSTRFPTELVLRRTSQIGATVSIVPHHSRIDSEKESLSSFHEELETFEGLANLIENAKSAMGISTHGKAFAKDLLRVEISGPDRPHLTIVDLPGLIHSQTKNQSASDVGLIQEVVESYMREPRSIILAVVSAKNDFANQVVLKLARSVDTSGNRTLGVITKPDTMHPGSESESLYVSLARNQEVEFRLGWHVLRNSDSEAGHGTLATRDFRELEFFSQGIWKELSESILGVDHLRSRLSRVLLKHITTELPSLIEEIEVKRSACQEKVRKLGQPRTTMFEQQLHLITIGESFQRLAQSAVDGNWNDPFFEDAESQTGYRRRIRAVVQNLNDNFAKDLSTRGHRRHITVLGEMTAPRHCIAVTRDEFIDHVQHKMSRSRGRQLPGLFDPMTVADLFRDQASPWENLARQHVRNTWKACRTFLEDVVDHVTDVATATATRQKIVQPAMDAILAELEAKTGDALQPHQTVHPITYNHYFTSTLQSIRKGREKDRVTRELQKFFGSNEFNSYHGSIDIDNLAKVLVDDTSEPDMHRLAASEALDHMYAYYEVAMERFLDGIAVDVIEAVLVSALPAIFSPIKVYKMTTDDIASIAGEPDETQIQRDQLTRQLKVLASGAETCKKFASAKLSAARNSETSDNEADDFTFGGIKGGSFVEPIPSRIENTVHFQPKTPPSGVEETVLTEVELSMPGSNGSDGLSHGDKQLVKDKKKKKKKPTSAVMWDE